jgi:hypothetical protein
MASYDHWLSHTGQALAKGAMADPGVHGPLSDFLEEHGDPLHVVVARSPAFSRWLKENTGDAGRLPMGPQSHSGYVVASDFPGLTPYPGPTFYIHHRAVGPKGGHFHIVTASLNFPGASGSNAGNGDVFVTKLWSDLSLS